MKKFIFLSASAAVALLSFTSCSDDDEPVIPNPDAPTTTAGAYILNQGNYYSNVDGALSLIDYNGLTVANDLFSNANGRSLGNTPQCGIAYGDKIYLGVYASSTIEVIDRNTYKSLLQITLPTDGSSEVGSQPRSMVANNGKVYISMYDGYVARLDTAALAIDKAVKVGNNPETMALYNNKLYVPNSDGMNYPNYGTTASVIDLDSFTVTNTFEVGLNPTKFVVAGNKLYLLAMGNYWDVASTVYEIENDTLGKIVAEATLMAAHGNNLYLVNAPYGGTTSYSVYNTVSEATTAWEPLNVDSVNGIGVDPINGNIIITSYPLSGGYTDYNSPGYALQYDSNGNFVKKYNVAAGPADIFFNMD